MHGQGTYVYANGVRYVGSFRRGSFHGEGVMYLPGKGSYTARWDNGREVEGTYTFKDGLAYEQQQWDYCTTEDRRYFSERKSGLNPAGASQIGSDPEALPLPPGAYDYGNGAYLVAGTDKVMAADGSVLKTVEPAEQQWLQQTARVGR